jgi:hypothetical protein
LEVDLISKKKILYPFWTESILEKSKKLLSCTRTDCADLVLNSWSSSAKMLLAGSWFTTKLPLLNKMSPKSSLKTSCLSSLSLLLETIGSELVGTEKYDENSKETKKIKEPAGKCTKIRSSPQ